MDQLRPPAAAGLGEAPAVFLDVAEVSPRARKLRLQFERTQIRISGRVERVQHGIEVTQREMSPCMIGVQLDNAAAAPNPATPLSISRRLRPELDESVEV